MPFILIGALGALALLFKTMQTNAETPGNGGVMTSIKTRLYNLKDVAMTAQGGNYKTLHDYFFEAAADEFGVPFALLKAHALQESSLNADAFRAENPANRADRAGWASRGLMQLLWADDKNNDLVPASKKLYDRFKKYGFSGDKIGNGNLLFDPNTNIRIAAQLIRDNLKSSGGNLRDAVNMYNAGVKESVRAAPGDYVGKVLNYYNKILGV